MKALVRLGLPGLLITIALALASCGGNAEGSGGGQGDDMQATERGGGGAALEETTGGGMSGMGTPGDEGSREMLQDENGDYSDARFVDAMVPHHEGAVEMAEVALENAQHQEIRTLARDIISAQRAEIRTLGDIRAELDAGPPTRMGEDMRMMGTMDPEELAKQRPFDKAFIDAMIPHHESAISMAGIALAESENPKVRSLAEDIIAAQEREIRQMETWRESWYPQG